MQRGSKLWPVVLIGFFSGLLIYTLQPDLNAASQQSAVEPAPPGQPLYPVMPAPAQPVGGVPRYTVVESQGVDLLVVDNTKNTLYFYACDRDKEAGADLKLRGSIDLSQVGQPLIRAKAHPTDEPGHPR